MKLKILHQGKFNLPKQSTTGSAGWDVHAIEDRVVPPFQVVTIPLGFAVEVPEDKFLSLVSRSSFGKKGIVIPNSIGVIDSDYRGEIKLMLLNLTQDFFFIKSGDRVAQMILMDYNPISIEVVDELSDTVRGTGGFGSTGISTIRPQNDEEGD